MGVHVPRGRIRVKDEKARAKRRGGWSSGWRKANRRRNRQEKGGRSFWRGTPTRRVHKCDQTARTIPICQSHFSGINSRNVYGMRPRVALRFDYPPPTTLRDCKSSPIGLSSLEMITALRGCACFRKFFLFFFQTTTFSKSFFHSMIIQTEKSTDSFAAR